VEPVIHYSCHEASDGQVKPADRHLLVEEPLYIQLGDEPLASLMRTPGHELDLTLGFLLTEGLIRSLADVGAISFCPAASGTNHVRVVAAPGGKLAAAPPPHRRIYSSCSVCGEDAIKEILESCPPFTLEPGRLSVARINALGEQMRRQQPLFRETGAPHAAALARRPLDDAALHDTIVREDVGRHNALDKAVGAALHKGMDLRQAVLFLSSRLSFEMVAKAARAGIADVVGASAPTALAVELANRLGMFLAGFARGAGVTVYSGVDALSPVRR